MPEVRISDVCRDFGRHRALDGVDLTIEPGSLTALVGPTGCGKTTLLELIAGLQNPTRGSITVDGEDVVGPRRDAILIFQQHNLFDWLTVRDNVAFGLRHCGLAKREARRRALEQLEKVGLAAFADRIVLFSASPGRPVEVVDVPAARPRNLEDGQLRHVRDRLLAHLEEEVALSEFAGAERAALADAGFTSSPPVVEVGGGMRDGSA